MKDTWSFNLPVDTLDEAIEVIFSEKSTELGIFLSYYFKGEGAVAEKVTLRKADHLEENCANLLLQFHLIYFNACLNIHEQEKDSLEVLGEFDPSSRTVTLTAPKKPERGMDEI